MHKQIRLLLALLGALALSTSAIRLTAAAALYTAADVGTPGAKGSTDVDAKGVWTIKGGGNDIWGPFDNFHFAYQKLKGDATITARFLSMEPSDQSEWTK